MHDDGTTAECKPEPIIAAQKLPAAAAGQVSLLHQQQAGAAHSFQQLIPGLVDENITQKHQENSAAVAGHASFSVQRSVGASLSFLRPGSEEESIRQQHHDRVIKRGRATTLCM